MMTLAAGNIFDCTENVAGRTTIDALKKYVKLRGPDMRKRGFVSFQKHFDSLGHFLYIFRFKL